MAVLSLISLPIHALLDDERSIELASVVVAVIGAIYAGFAIQGGTVCQMVIEGLVASLFLAGALAGLWCTPWVIPVAYVLHGIWDALHHRSNGHRDLVMIPRWYPPFCAVYDWIFAIGLALLWAFN
ncbi:MAG: DUF6010 family protein [bacterium]